MVDLVMPRMRAVVSAFWLMVNTFIGFSLGPYTIGRISDAYAASGQGGAEALGNALLTGFSVLALAGFFLFMSSRHIQADEESRLDRARALGEPV